MTDKEKIRAEIERLKKCSESAKMEWIHTGYNQNAFAEDCRIASFNKLLSFIDSMQEEPVKIKKGCKYLCLGDMFNNDTGKIGFIGGKIYLAPEDNTLVSEENGCRCDTSENASNFELVEEPVSIWHDASEEPNDTSHCLIFYGCKESVGHYLHYEPVLYNKKEKMFVTSSLPHPTGYKRDRISISDITQWCYLCDLHNLSNVERTVKDWKEEPIIEVLGRYLDRVPDEEVLKTKIAINEWFNEYFPKLEPVSEDLEEAAFLYYPKMSRISEPHGIIPADYESHYLGDANEDNRKAFKAGAQWMHKKMIHELNLKEE